MTLTVGRVALEVLSRRRLQGANSVTDNAGTTGLGEPHTSLLASDAYALQGVEVGITAEATMEALRRERRRRGDVYVTETNDLVPEGYYRMAQAAIETESPGHREWQITLREQNDPVVWRQAEDENVLGTDTTSRNAEESEYVLYDPSGSDGELIVVQPRTVTGAEPFNLPAGTWRALARIYWDGQPTPAAGGEKMYVLDSSTNRRVEEYDLSTAWDVSTSSLLQTFAVGGQDQQPGGQLFFKPDGTRFFFVGDQNDSVYEYSLSTAWDISTATFVKSQVLSDGVDPAGLFFRSDGEKMYVVYQSAATLTPTIHEYDLGTAWDVATLTHIQSIAVTDQSNFVRNVFFKPDGLKMYHTGGEGGATGVFEYDLSVAWDISTAAFSQSLNTQGTDSQPQDFFIRDDGLKLYVAGLDGDSVYEYDLGTAWDVSTATLLQSFAVSALVASGLFFKVPGPEGPRLRWRVTDLAGATLADGSQTDVLIGEEWHEVNLGDLVVAEGDAGANWYEVLADDALTADAVWLDRVRFVRIA